MKPLKRGRVQSDDEELDDYIPSDSDNEYTEAEKKILENTRKGLESDDNESEEEVYGVLSSDDEAKHGGDDDMGSDLDGNDDDDLPNVRAWGKTKKNFYSTDYVDQDYGGFQGKDAEEADYEEQEAREIQQRLAKQLDDQDFSFDIFIGDKAPAEEAGQEKEKVKTDLSKLTKRQKLAMFHKESPEYSGLVEDFKVQLKETEEKLLPFLALIAEHKIPDCPAVTFVKTKYQLILNYCTNISFYLLLKARRKPVETHPIVRRLVQYRQLMLQLAPLWTDIVAPQVDQLLEMQREGKEIQFANSTTPRATERKLLKLLKTNVDEDQEEEPDKLSKKRNGKLSTKTKVLSGASADLSGLVSEESDNDDDMEEGAAEAEGDDEAAKRGITYQIAKNKGLTPHRKKEQRNPRVKNRNKFRKAQIQRRGQVRTVRTEVVRYGGEISGIKPGLKKGIKIKV